MPRILLVEAAEIASWSDFAPVITALSDQFSLTTVIAYLGSLVAATVVFVFAWWGIRKAYGAIMAAVRGRFPGL